VGKGILQYIVYFRISPSFMDTYGLLGYLNLHFNCTTANCWHHSSITIRIVGVLKDLLTVRPNIYRHSAG